MRALLNSWTLKVYSTYIVLYACMYMGVKINTFTYLHCVYSYSRDITIGDDKKNPMLLKHIEPF